MEHRDESADQSNIYIIWALVSYLLVYIVVIPIHIRVTQTTHRIALRYRLLNDFVIDYVKEGDFKNNFLTFCFFFFSISYFFVFSIVAEEFL